MISSCISNTYTHRNDGSGYLTIDLSDIPKGSKALKFLKRLHLNVNKNTKVASGSMKTNYLCKLMKLLNQPSCRIDIKSYNTDEPVDFQHFVANCNCIVIRNMPNKGLAIYNANKLRPDSIQVYQCLGFKLENNVLLLDCKVSNYQQRLQATKMYLPTKHIDFSDTLQISTIH